MGAGVAWPRAHNSHKTHSSADAYERRGESTGGEKEKKMLRFYLETNTREASEQAGQRGAQTPKKSKQANPLFWIDLESSVVMMGWCVVDLWFLVTGRRMRMGRRRRVSAIRPNCVDKVDRIRPHKQHQRVFNKPLDLV